MSEFGIKVARRGQDNNQAGPKDTQLDTRLLSLPILKKVKVQMVAAANVVFNTQTASAVDPSNPPTVRVEHPFDYSPLFRAWIEDVDPTTGAKTGNKVSVPCVQGGFLFYGWSDTDYVYLRVSSTTPGLTPTVQLTYDGFLYIFDTDPDDE